jgi:hypothetical protein
MEFQFITSGSNWNEASRTSTHDCGGISNWPPIWVWTGGKKNELPRGEVGVLVEVRPSLLDIKRLFLIIQYNDSEYMDCLSFDDAAFCREIYVLLKSLYRHSISAIGELDIGPALV